MDDGHLVTVRALASLGQPASSTRPMLRLSRPEDLQKRQQEINLGEMVYQDKPTRSPASGGGATITTTVNADMMKTTTAHYNNCTTVNKLEVNVTAWLKAIYDRKADLLVRSCQIKS